MPFGALFEPISLSLVPASAISSQLSPTQPRYLYQVPKYRSHAPKVHRVHRCHRPTSRGTNSAPSAATPTATSTALHRQGPFPGPPPALSCPNPSSSPTVAHSCRCCSGPPPKPPKPPKHPAFSASTPLSTFSHLLTLYHPLRRFLSPQQSRQLKRSRIPLLTNYTANHCHVPLKCSSSDVHDSWLLPALPLGRPHDNQNVDSTLAPDNHQSDIMEQSQNTAELPSWPHDRPSAGPLAQSASMPLRTASSTPVSSPGLFSPTPSRHIFHASSMSESNTPAPPAGGPFLHPLQTHKVRE